MILSLCCWLIWLPQTQTDPMGECLQRLAKAQQEFNLGYYGEVIDLVGEDCLGVLLDGSLVEAHELRYRSYFAMDELEQTRAVIQKLLIAQPDYQAPVSFGPELVQLVGELRASSEDQIDSVSFFAEDIDAAPATVAVITGEEIARKGYRDLGEVLAALPGLEVTRPSGAEQLLVHPRGFLGIANDALLLRIDGVEQNDLFYGTTYLSSQYPLSFIDKVVFVYGPASTVYGPNANLGVIDVITRVPKRQAGVDQVDVRVSAGARESQRYDLFLNGALGLQGEPLRYALTANLAKSSGFDVSDRKDSLWYGRSDFEDAQDNHWFSVRFWTQNLSFGLQHWRRSEGNNTDDYNAYWGKNQWTPVQLLFFLNYQTSLGKGWDFQLQARSKEYDNDAEASSNVRRVTQGEDGEVDGIRYQIAHWSYSATQNRYKLQVIRQSPNQHLDLAFGADYRVNALPGGLKLVETGELIRPRYAGLGRPPDQFNDRDLGLFANLSYHFNPRWSASAGIRYDHNQSKESPEYSFPSSSSPRLALLYRRDEQLGFKLLYAEAFLNPSLGTSLWLYRYLSNDLLEPGQGGIFIASPQPRKSSNLELASHLQWGRTELEVSVYRFTQTEAEGLGERPDAQISFREGDRRNNGLQLQAKTQLTDPLALTVNASFIDARINRRNAWKDTGFVAQEQLNLNLDYRGSFLDAGLQCAWTGKRHYDPLYTEGLSAHLDRYLLIDAYVGGRMPRLDSVTWHCGLHNLGDLDYDHGSAFFYEFVPQPGREVTFRLTYKR